MAELKILAPARWYGWTFSGPRASRHTVERRRYLPLGKLYLPLHGLMAINPLPPRHFDLVHAYNRIPIGLTPFVIGFESHLPRAYPWHRGTAYWNWMCRILASDRCRAIVPISHYAARHFRRMHASSPWAAALEAKTAVRYPNVPVPEALPNPARFGAERLRVVFVGNHFGRKGGCVAVKLAQKAHECGLDLEVHVVSDLTAGSAVWTDPTDAAFFQPYFDLLSLPNVVHHNRLPNAEVMRLLCDSHLSILTTFQDTFGFSAIEAMAQGTPVVVTRTGALQEFVRDRENGFVLDLATDSLGDWVQSDPSGRDQHQHKAIYAAEVERMAGETLAILQQMNADRASLARIAGAAWRTARQEFCAEAASRYWDEVYEAASRRSEPVAT